MSTSAILHERKQAVWESFQIVKDRCAFSTDAEERDRLYLEMDGLLRELERMLNTERKRPPPP
jgi:hypothetical protein